MRVRLARKVLFGPLGAWRMSTVARAMRRGRVDSLSKDWIELPGFYWRVQSLARRMKGKMTAARWKRYRAHIREWGRAK